MGYIRHKRERENKSSTEGQREGGRKKTREGEIGEGGKETEKERE